MRIAFRLVPFAAAALAAAGCASAAGAGVRWEPEVLYEGPFAFERIRVGRPDAANPGPQVVGVDQGGRVVLVRWEGGVPRSEIVHDHLTELTGLAVADVDPDLPGEEIYAGGNGAPDGRTGEGGRLEGTGGAVLQIALGPGGPRVRRVFEGGAYVHSVEPVPPQAAGDPVRLLVTTYAGEVLLLTPAPGDGPWPARLLYREPAAADPEVPKIKDAAFLRDPAGGPPHEVLLALKTGRAVLLDIARPGGARLVHEEKGGLSRVTADPEGGAFVTGYAGRVLHFVRSPDGLRVEVAGQDGSDSGLRGFVFGRYPLPDGGTADRVVFGFHALCRALVPRNGAWDPVTLFKDTDRGHTIDAADLVPGNDADELVMGGYSRRITMIVARPDR